MTTSTDYPFTRNEGILRKRLVCEAVQHDEWHGARTEYRVIGLRYAALKQYSCMCSHTPIQKLCILKNVHTGKKYLIGSDCVTKFISTMGIRFDLVLNCLRKLERNVYASATDHMSNYAHEQGWINTEERQFCWATVRKRLNPVEMAWRASINARILRGWHQQQATIDIDDLNSGMAEAAD